MPDIGTGHRAKGTGKKEKYPYQNELRKGERENPPMLPPSEHFEGQRKLRWTKRETQGLNDKETKRRRNEEVRLLRVTP